MIYKSPRIPLEMFEENIVLPWEALFQKILAGRVLPFQILDQDILSAGIAEETT